MYDEIFETFNKVAKDNINRDLFNNSTESAEDIINDIKNNKIVIYTAFTGDYDSLKEPDFIDENCDYVCFTDNDNLKSNVWKIVKMESSLLDNNRKAKQYKVLPHNYFPDYKYSFWLDGTFKIKGSLREYIYKNIKANSNMLCVVHTERDCIYEEYNASKIIPRYPRAVMEEQIEVYKSENFPKHYGMAVMGSIFRKHNDSDVIELMDAWWGEIIKYSNQDQISFAYLCWKYNFHPSVSLIYYWENEYWAKETIKKNQYHHNLVPVTPITSENLLSSLKDKVDKMELGESLKLSDEELYLLLNDVKGLAGYRLDTAGRIGYLNNLEHEILNSNSMKVTKPLRFITNSVRDLKILLKNKSTTSAISKKLKNLKIINENIYKQYHSEVNYDIYNHFVEFSSKNDDLSIKKLYINPSFDLDYYIESNNLNNLVDPLIHFVEEGFDKKVPINSEGVLILNFENSINDQIDKYVNDLIENELNTNYYITNEKILNNYLISNKLFNTDTIKVGVFLEDYFENMNACPFIRIHTLFKELSKSKDYHFFIYGKDDNHKFDEVDIINDKIFDIVVIQRCSYLSTRVLKQCKRHNIKIIYETDDNLLNANENHPNYEYLSFIHDNVFDLIVNSNEIVVSTNNLASQFEKLGISNITVIKNYFLNNILTFKPFSSNSNKTIKIGYFGTLTHDDDLLMLKNTFLKLKEGEYEFDLEVVGAISNKEKWYNDIPLPNYPMSMESFWEWVQKTVNWDIGIIPLINSEFNKSKSELKFIEFTALGVPVIASPIESYIEAIEDNVTGLLAYDENQWLDKIKFLINNPQFREEIYNNAKKEIIEKYDMESRVNQWDKLFKRLI